MYTIIRKKDLCTSVWSGGTTTQLAIYPPQSIYAQRNFKWRVSSAQVDDETSTFTSLPNIARILMPLEGDLELSHKSKGDFHLAPFDQNHFWGDWHTTSCGKVKDFNVMLSEGSSKVDVLHLESTESYLNNTNLEELQYNTFFPTFWDNPLDKEEDCMSELYYFYEGTSFEVLVANKKETLLAGDVLVYTAHKDEWGKYKLGIIAQAPQPSVIIKVQILHSR